MTWNNVHLSVTRDPNEPVSTLCGKQMTNPVAVPLAQEEKSPLDHPRLCKGCRRVAESTGWEGLVWESGVMEGEEQHDAVLSGNQ